MSTIAKGSLFSPELERELFNAVKGHSSLAVLSNQEPLSFNGNDVFVFDFAGDVALVAEGANKPAGDGTVTSKTITPYKVVYGMRVNDEFVYASEEKQIDYLSAFVDGFGRKMAKGLDLMAMHGFDPSTKAMSTLIGNNCFDKAVTVNVVEYDNTKADANIDAAIAMVEAGEYQATGLAISPAMRGAIAALETDAGRKYPEFAFGGAPATLGAVKLDTNVTVSAKSTDEELEDVGEDHAIVGDFENCFRWGIAKEIPVEVIKYGDPDGNGDLSRKNQVYLRAEAYIGWAIMDASAFARIKAEDEEEVEEGA